MRPYPLGEDGFASAWRAAETHCRWHPAKPIWLYVAPKGGYEVSVIEPCAVAEGTVALRLTPDDFKEQSK